MAIEFTLPDLGESVKSGTLAKFLVAPGDTIEVDQPILELETDKAVLEVPSNMSGTVGELLAQPGAKLSVGQPVFMLETSAVPAAKEEQAAPEKAAADGAQGDKKADPVTAGGLATGTDVGAPVQSSNGKASTPPSAPATPAGHSGAAIPAPPSVRRLARELGVDIAQVRGTGRGGRITFSDVRAFLQGSLNGGGGVAAGVAAAPLPDFTRWGEIERQPLSNVRRATAMQMSYSWSTVARVTQFDKADVTELENLRKKYAKKTEAAGGKLTVTAIALKVVAAALRKFPQFNSSLDMAAGEVVLKKYVHIGVAVDTDRGLLVPVIRNVDQKSIIELAAELAQIAAKARDRKISLDDLQGGTFTLTNLGGIGGTNFTPIVNAPEVAILGMARGNMEPVWNGSAFEPRLMLPLALSYDHRAIDGADGARFLRWIAEALEQPFLLSLEGGA